MTDSHTAGNTYIKFFDALSTHGIEVYAFDQRGWGRSVTKTAERGLTGKTDRVLDDMTSFIKSVLPSPIPLFLIGHSMGGGQVLYYAARGPSEIRKHIRGYLLISPFVDFSPASKPWKATVIGGRLLGKLFPRRQMMSGLNVDFVSRDPEVQKAIKEDELCHDTGTLEGLAAMLDRTLELSTGRIKIPADAGEGGVTRIWIAHGSEDGLTNFAASKRFAETCVAGSDKEFKAYDGHYHRLHDEPEPYRNQFLTDVVDWILARSGELGQEDGGQSKL
ncbi:alpha/beta-hydrolase [Sporormia fimetaria CBS 119925]|uniref:Alpha/beta-hydrolase n=1 Tax=Sporormia fimetaria CBS 119925 TaxID=1340428 RepID=A0A6A6VME0_9PLEO|nr:alpha/beta-hydrolase [Sporormia fimetaria CBS 119925]